MKAQQNIEYYYGFLFKKKEDFSLFLSFLLFFLHVKKNLPWKNKKKKFFSRQKKVYSILTSTLGNLKEAIIEDARSGIGLVVSEGGGLGGGRFIKGGGITPFKTNNSSFFSFLIFSIFSNSCFFKRFGHIGLCSSNLFKQNKQPM